MQRIYFTVNLLSIVLFTVTLLPTDVSSKEPKSFKDLWDNWDAYSHSEEPFVYRIQNTPDTVCGEKCLSDLGTLKGIGHRSDGSPITPNARSGFLLDSAKTSFCININTFSSLSDVKKAFIGTMASYSGNFVYLMPSAVSVFTGYCPPPNVPRSFFDTRFEKNLIGNISFDRRFGNFEEHSVYQVVFTRGNTLVCIHFPYPKNGAFRKEPYPDKQVPEDYQLDKNGLNKWKLETNEWKLNMVAVLCDAKQSFDIDLRKIAYQYDRYLTDCPLKELQDDERQKLKTLDIRLLQDTALSTDKKYQLDFSRKLVSGGQPDEIRLIVSHGEIEQEDAKKKDTDPIELDLASLAPGINGRFSVKFCKEGKQWVRCYHINKEGKCLAWGEIEVSVEQQKRRE
ncbi:MAG: hypothetical protein LBU65_09940 [Planctomycetaceae bacterium]|jgi:hypothetical protein|nr:hypothetical protein [Planctomycetaceae bacterium]